MSASSRLYVIVSVPSSLSTTMRPAFAVTKVAASRTAFAFAAIVAAESPAVTATVSPPTVIFPPPEVDVIDGPDVNVAVPAAKLDPITTLLNSLQNH